MNARMLYAFFSLKVNRNFMLEKIEKGLDKSKLNIPFKIDKKEDEISKDVLTNWKHLEKSLKMEYCRMVLDGSQKVTVWGLTKKEEFKQKIKESVKNAPKSVSEKITKILGGKNGKKESK